MIKIKRNLLSLACLSMICSLSTLSANAQSLQDDNKQNNNSSVSGVTQDKQSSGSVTLYGRVAADLEVANFNGDTNKSVNSNNSYVGLKARENFSGLNYVYTDLQIGVGVDSGNVNGNNGNDPTFRKAVIGIGNGYGNLWLGRGETAYYKVAKQFDPFAGESSASNLSILGQTPYTNYTAFNPTIGFNNWRSNTIGIETAPWNNLQLLATYSNKEKELTDPATSSIALVYDNNAIAGALSFERQNFEGNNYYGGGNDKAMRASVSYTFASNTKLFANAERIKNNRDFLSYKRNAYSVGVSQPLGAHELMGSYTQASSGSSNSPLHNAMGSDLGAKQLSVGYKYNFSKRTAAMATASYIRNGDNANYNLAYNPVDLNSGSNIKYVSLGLIHKF